jgi:signal transduction histidine kinase
LLRLVTNNFPAFLSIIIQGEQDLIVDFTSGKEFEKLNLDPASFVGKTLEEVFGDQAAIVRGNYKRAFMGEEVSFELFINDQNQLYNAIPLIGENGAIDRIMVVVENVTERKLFEAQSQQAAATAERERLGRELHDAVTQTLFSASVIAKALPDIWEKDPAIGRTYMEQLPRLLKGALAEMRTLLLELRPNALREQTLGQLLELLAEAARARSGAIVTLKVEGDRPLPEDVSIALHRIAQESLNNVAKHAESTHISIWLRLDQSGVKLHISDDGRGFDPETIPSGHLGVRIMRERAQKIGATFQIDSKPGDGTIVIVTWSDQA